MGTAILKEQTKALDKTINKLIFFQKELRAYQETPQIETTMGPQGFMIDSELNTLEIIKKVRKEMDGEREKYGKLNTEAEVASMMDVLEKAILKAQIFSDANEGLGIGIINNLKNITIEAGDSVADILTKITKATSGLNSFNDAIQNASMLTGEFVKAQVALTKKATTPYDDMLSALEAIGDQFKALDTLAPTERTMVQDDFGGGAKSSPYLESVTKARARLAAIIIKEGKLREKLGIETEAELMAYIQSTRERVNIIREHQGELKKLQRIEKDVARLNKASGIGRTFALKANIKATETVRKQEELLTTTKINQNKEISRGLTKQLAEAEAKLAIDQENKELGREVLGISERIAENTKANVALESQLDEVQKRKLDEKLEEKQLSHALLEDAMTMFKVSEKLFEIDKKRTALQQTQQRNAVALANLKDPQKIASGDTAINASQEYNLFVKMEKQKKDTIQKEWAMASTRIGLEFALLKAKTEMLVMESRVIRDRVIAEAEGNQTKIDAAKDTHTAYATAAQGYIDSQLGLVTQRLLLAGIEKDTALSSLTLEKERLKVAALRHGQEAFSAGSGSFAQGGGGRGGPAGDFVSGIRASNKAYREATEQRATIRKKAENEAAKNYDAGTLPGMGVFKDKESAVASAGDTAVTDAGLDDPTVSVSGKIGMMRDMTSGMVEQLKQLGPEGAVVASVAEGMFTVSAGFANVFDTVEAGGDKMEVAAAALGAVGQTVMAIGAIMKASSDARIAGYDKEIAAEKKRDGKSKQSLAKIKALEAKREQEAKKGFERQKKMQMASTIINTAAAVVSALTFKPEGWWNIPLAVMIGAMGAAQLAMIAGQSYQGGGGGGGAVQAPSAISMGSRNNKVDIAGGRGNAAGELSYLRGGRGSGSSAADFRPAFAGRKYRAAGGAAYVVGEQGPELFVPSVPGRVVSNDDMETAASAGNINFTINAIDAAGVEEVLVEQRGNIIGMIRESANEYGSGFLEDVNEDSYTSTTEGSVYGRA